jgi:hypothetical protein
MEKYKRVLNQRLVARLKSEGSPLLLLFERKRGKEKILRFAQNGDVDF